MISKQVLEQLYIYEKLSAKQIAVSLSRSAHTIVYWLDKYTIPRRTISEAVYQRHNPKGDPFKVMPVRNKADIQLQGNWHWAVLERRYKSKYLFCAIG